MKYYHKKSGQPVKAIQFTGPESAYQIGIEFSCHVNYDSKAGTITIGSVVIHRGEYAVMPMFQIVAVPQKRFDKRFRKDEWQMELI